ncbi:POK18 protein, partial [Emberiza fucata]|nr:POK18 protein [Emberiza fucata]
DAPRFAFTVPSINCGAPRKRYHWCVLPQEMKNSPVICQWYVASLLSPVRTAVEDAIFYHYMDDILVCAPTDDILTHALDLTISALVAAGFELQQEKIQRMPPWKYLGLEITRRTIVPQKLAIKTNVKTLADVHQLCGSLNWVRPWLGIPTDDLAPLFNLLKGGEELSSPRSLTPEAQTALEKIQESISARQAHRYQPGLPFKFIILGKLPHLRGMIFQWDKASKELLHLKRGKNSRKLQRSPKTILTDLEMASELIIKARTRLLTMSGRNFSTIHLPLKKDYFDWVMQKSKDLLIALLGYPGICAIHFLGHRLLKSKICYREKPRISEESLDGITVFTDGS